MEIQVGSLTKFGPVCQTFGHPWNKSSLRKLPFFWKSLRRSSACPASEQKLGWLRMPSCTAELILRWSRSSWRAGCSGGSLKSSLYSSSHVWIRVNSGLQRQKSRYTLTASVTLEAKSRLARFYILSCSVSHQPFAVISILKVWASAVSAKKMIH